MKRIAIGTWLLVLAAVAHAAPFQNGSFEIGAPVCSQQFITQGNPIGPGWIVSVGDVDWVGSCDWDPQDGTHSLDLLGGLKIGGVQQTFDTVPGATYQVTFALAGNPGPVPGSPPIKPLTVTVAGTTHNYLFDVTGHSAFGNMGWIIETFTFVATGFSETINFVSDMTYAAGGFAGAALDNVTVTLVSGPALIGVVAQDQFTAKLIGRIDSAPNSVGLSLDVFSASSCGGLGAGAQLPGPIFVNTDAAGYFLSSPLAIPLGAFASYQVTGSSTGQSNCLVSSAFNEVWPFALPLTGNSPVVQDYIDASGRARWYRFDVTPGQRIQTTLFALPADYDVAVFKDIGQAFFSLLGSTPDLTKLSAEFAPSMFSPSMFSPSMFSPSMFSPDAYTPSMFSPSMFSPSMFSPSMFSPSMFSPSMFSPSMFSPSMFSPSMFSPSMFSPSMFSPSVFSPSMFSPDLIAMAFSSAQTRSILGMSATAGLGDEAVVVNTWNETGSFYVRVTGRSGAFSTSAPFTLGIVKGATTCGGVTDTAPPSRGPAGGFNLKTIVVTDSSKVALDAPLQVGGTLATKLNAFMARPEVAGILVDVASDTRVTTLKSQAANNTACPFAKNLVAREVKAIIDSYRLNNPNLRYVVIAGNDDAIPFFRYPDESLLGPESDYFPPVASASASEASLRRDFVLGQDAYGSNRVISLRSTDFPVPGLAVGRLVETPSEMAAVLDAYTAANGMTVPHKSLVTGYDFLQDAADAVKNEFALGTGATPDTLIAPNNLSPLDPASWTSADLRQKLLYAPRYDVVFLAGHFTANSLLAADFATSIVTTELPGSPSDLSNAVVFSAGCHAAYNLVDTDAIDGVTLKLDWAQAFAQKGATLIAGTGYQYGDTDFVEYGERLYNNFARELRSAPAGTPVSVGEALMKAKLDYLAATPDIRGLHQKTLLEASVFGLPMLSVNMPGTRTSSSTGTGVTPTPVPGPGPAASLGLETFELHPSYALHLNSTTLTNVSTLGSLTASWYNGPDGVAANPAEPALPLVSVNVTATDGSVLRGVGFRGGDYADENDIVPLTGAPTTELRGVHTPFLSPVFYPMRLATPNYYGALSGGGATGLLITPAQHRAYDVAAGTSTRRTLTNMTYRLYYSKNTSLPALSDAPTIVRVDAVPNGSTTTFAAQVLGDPKATIHEVWVTYANGGVWTSLDLTQSSADSQVWTGQVASALPAGTKFIVQAASGIGLVSLDDNLGSYYDVGGAAPFATAIAFGPTPPPPSGADFGDNVAITAALSGAGMPLAGEVVMFSVGGTARSGTTDAMGSVTVNVPIVATPGTYPLTASFAGDTTFLPSAVSEPFDVAEAPTTLTPAASGAGAILTASLGSSPTPQPLMQQSIQFSVTGPSGPQELFAITDFTGLATLPPPGLPPGTYSVSQAHFAGNASYAAATLNLAQSFDVYQGAGFVQPVDNPPTLNVAKAGQSVPVKFSLGGDRGLNIFAPGYPASKPVSCAGFTSTGSIDKTVTAGNSTLQYDTTTGLYTYIWKTNSAWVNTCRALIMSFRDGTQRIADFRFKK